ncbi:hypothetical protein [Microcoleus sp. herbarium14]|uniref:hypothetical protein n=1 Tax=Microcoleus sp. herbarium14 TaxID=3055439 RepID=UPI002FD5DD55
MLDRIYLVFDDVGGRVWFDADRYVVAVGYCGVKDDDFPWLVALDATNQGKIFF